MPRYQLEYDVTASFCVSIEAESEEDALRILYDSDAPSMNVDDTDPDFMQEDITAAYVVGVE